MATVLPWVVALGALALVYPAYRRVRTDPDAPTRQVWRATTGSAVVVGAFAAAVTVLVAAVATALFPWASWGWLTQHLDQAVPLSDVWNLAAMSVLIVPVAVLVVPRVCLESEVLAARTEPFRGIAGACKRSVTRALMLFLLGFPLAVAAVMVLATEITSAVIWGRSLARNSPLAHESLSADDDREVQVGFAAARPWKRNPLVARAWNQLSPAAHAAILTTATVQTVMAWSFTAFSLGVNVVLSMV